MDANIIHVFRWGRTCAAMETKLYQFSDNSQVTGWLHLMRGGAESHTSHRIAGSEFEYQCSSGFYLSNKTNPVQKLFCQGSLQVDTSLVSSCVRKFHKFRNCATRHICVSAMECEDTPDKGEDSGAAGYIWDDLKLYNKQINVSCPVGKVFKLIFFHSIKCQL